MTACDTYLERHRDRYIAELLDFLKIPSISSLPEHAADVYSAARWVADRLHSAGIENIEIIPTRRQPVVFGDWLHAPDQPTVMLYGHFDVQPVDPLDHWTRPPFEPEIRGNRIYARGASDDKGNMLVPIIALETLLKTQKKLPVNVKCFFEGQEEIGSPDLPELIKQQRDRLACDMVISADGGQWGIDQPAIVVSRRGICALQIDVESANQDLHSGTYGGAFMNPIQALIHLLATLHTPEGAVAVDGFYDTVRILSATERAQVTAVAFDAAKYMSDIGIAALFGEPGYSTRERTWVRPTLEFNGIWGGFQGENIKTVIPSQAHAKISCRLVPDQDPQSIIDRVRAHLLQHSPAGVRLKINPIMGHAFPSLTPADHPGNRIAGEVLNELYGKEPYIIRMGGTIPVSGLFEKHLNAHMISFGFGLEDENIHAPDEFFRISSFERGQKAYCRLLTKLAHRSAAKVDDALL
jgi:acetylornithine deacetylase/succinyl-diaminopimelate desuccinylase-like protein